VGFGRLFRGVSRGVIGRRKFSVFKFFTLKLSGTDGAACSVNRGPHHLKQLGLSVGQDLSARLQGLDGNNVSAVQLHARLKAAAAIGHVFYQSSFTEGVTRAVSTRNLHGNIIYGSAFFSSSLTVDHFTQPAYVLLIPIHDSVFLVLNALVSLPFSSHAAFQLRKKYFSENK
jgi:hypothetical protein